MKDSSYAAFVNTAIFHGVKEFKATNGQHWRCERGPKAHKGWVWRCSLHDGDAFVHNCHILASKNPTPAKLYAAMLDD